MITNHYTGSLDRDAKLKEISGLKIIDIGGANSFAHGFLDAVIDIREPQASAQYKFVGDICTPDLWEEVLAHVEKFGKWDYAICTHTLEDVVNPMYAAQMISKIAKAGVVITPSKYREFGIFQGKFRGYMHHFWIFDVLDGVYTCWPKHNFIEDEKFDCMPGPVPSNEECVIEWEGEIGLQMINAGMPFGTADMSGEKHMAYLYDQLLKPLVPFNLSMMVLTVCDKIEPAAQLIRSLEKQGIRYHVEIAPFQFGGQMPVIYKWCKTQSPGQQFLYTDAFDTFALDQLPEVVDEMIISCEKACYPHPERAIDYPPCESEWKYVNGGGFVTTAQFFIEMYEKHHNEADNDQVYLMEIFLNNQDRIKLDTGCKIFQTIAFEAEDDFTLSGGRLFNNKTKTYPVFVHGNGHTDMSKVYKLID